MLAALANGIRLREEMTTLTIAIDEVENLEFFDDFTSKGHP